MQPPLEEATLSAVLRSAEAFVALLHGELNEDDLRLAIDHAHEIGEMLEDLAHARRTRGLDHPYTRKEAEADLATAIEARFTNPQIIKVVVDGAWAPVVCYQDHPQPWQSSGEMVYCRTPLEFAESAHRTLSTDAENRRR